MKWSLVMVGPAPTDLDDVMTAARADRAATPATPEAVGDLLRDPETNGLLVLGNDADLAATVETMLTTGRDVPVALIPRVNSDLLRMFGLSRMGVLGRLQTGGPYRADLGWITIGGVRRPFVAHVTASSRRPFGGLHPPARLGVSTDRRSYRLDGWWMAVANSQHVAGRNIAPKAALMDGELDVQVFGGSVTARLRLLRLAKRGLHLRHRAVWRRSVESCSVSIPDHWRVEADGVPVGTGPFEVVVDRGAFALWV